MLKCIWGYKRKICSRFTHSICHTIDFTAFGLYRDHPQALILNNFKKFLNLSKQKVLIFKKYSLKRVSSKNVQSSDFLLDYDSPNSTGPSFLRFITKVDFQIFGLTQIWPWAITNHQRRGKIINLKLDRLLSNTVRFWLLSRIMIRKLN